MQAFGEGITKTSRISERKEEIEDLRNIQGAQVLLVEDNEINQQVAMEILQGAGLNVTVANDGQEAVNAVKESNYDAVLMDIQMPVMDGYTASREIRKWEETKPRRGKSKSEVGMRDRRRKQRAELKAQSSMEDSAELSAFSFSLQHERSEYPLSR